MKAANDKLKTSHYELKIGNVKLGAEHSDSIFGVNTPTKYANGLNIKDDLMAH